MKIIFVLCLLSVTFCGIFRKKNRNKQEDPVGIVLKQFVDAASPLLKAGIKGNKQQKQLQKSLRKQ